MARPAAKAAARWTAATGCLLLALAAAPQAQASFTDSAVASTTFSTAVIGSPTLASVTPVCTNKKTLTLTVSVAETVAYANKLDVTITSGTDTMAATQGITEVKQHQLTVVQGAKTVDFTYTVLGLYTPAGSTNTWRSAAPLTRTVTCS